MKKAGSKIKSLWAKYRPKDRKRKIIWLSCGGALIVLAAGIAAAALSGNRDETVYKETQVIKGTLAAGVTETGSIDVGTTTQTFDLDISEFTESASFSFGGGMDMMMGMAGQSSSGSSSSVRQLEIEEVYVEAGQEISEGDPILKLTEESVNSIRTELAEDVSSAEIVYNQAVTSKQQTETDALSEYKLDTLYQTYAQSEYSQTVAGLQDAVAEKEEALEEAQETLDEAQTLLAEKQSLLAEEKQVLENAVFTAEGTDQDEALYWWVVAWRTKQDAETMVETLEDEIGQLQENIETYTEESENAALELELARKDLETGEIEAQGQLSLRSYRAENAGEIYDVTVDQSEFDLQTALRDYEEAQTKLEEFDEAIVEQVIYSSSNGLVTDVPVSAGDTLTQNIDLISFNDYDNVTITLSVEEDDMEAAALGNQVNITAAAFADEVFKGTVTEIGDAEIDSNTNKTLYSVTVTFSDTTDLLYQDMTAEVTFVTDEVSEVLYVPNRAISEENGTSCVKVRNADGDIETRHVTTGISDGVNTEIKEGLSEGETVLLESKVG